MYYIMYDDDVLEIFTNATDHRVYFRDDILQIGRNIRNGIQAEDKTRKPSTVQTLLSQRCDKFYKTDDNDVYIIENAEIDKKPTKNTIGVLVCTYLLDTIKELVTGKNFYCGVNLGVKHGKTK